MDHIAVWVMITLISCETFMIAEYKYFSAAILSVTRMQTHIFRLRALRVP